MRLHRTKIDYLTHTWNFYSGCLNWQNGVCAVGKHCWAKSITKRFEKNYPNGFKPTFYPEAFMEPLKFKKPARIGCAFMGDLFGDWVDPKMKVCSKSGTVWIPENRMWAMSDLSEGTLQEVIIEVIKRTPQHTFIFLTKCPQNLRKWSPFPDNCWVGTSLTGLEDDFYKRVDCLNKVKANVKFISFEPLLGTIGY
ncbi:MAG: DUF5131 family protein, partial [Dehalococcoidales bacterium]|nr:DUF5131 family protein [Dehalococcoidales bacterium]